MISRVWHGYTKPEDADAYEAMLKPELLPGIGKAQGYQGSYLLRRNVDAEVEFITIMLWDSMDDIKAGTDYEAAVIPQERRKYFISYDAKSAHFEVASLHKVSNPRQSVPEALGCEKLGAGEISNDQRTAAAGDHEQFISTHHA